MLIFAILKPINQCKFKKYVVYLSSRFFRHQTKVAGKLQKLPFSDFKQFKFNITPFTNLYRQELLATPSHLTDDEKSIKWVKNYLHHHRYVCRYSDKGVPLKSKGTLVWVVEAKKTEDGGWIFKEFERKFQPEPEAKAMVGGLWEWKPRIMDPRNKRKQKTIILFYLVLLQLSRMQ